MVTLTDKIMTNQATINTNNNQQTTLAHQTNIAYTARTALSK